MKLLLVLSLILTAALLFVSFAGAGELTPNELGRIMILEYHKIDYPEAQWTRTPENFRRDLETLYAKGYRVINMGDLLDRKIALPAGTTPVILTFDDSSPGQFRYLENNGTLEIDPKCAVGILEAFFREHPDFGRGGTFYVLPGASPPNRLFNQPAFEGKKLQFLASHGYEIGNHTLWHANLGKYDDATVQKQLALSVEAIQKRVPGYAVRSLALPFGVYPKDLQLAVKGEFKGTSYRHEAILMVAGGASQSPFSTGCDLLHLPRIQVPGPDFKYWLSYYEKHASEIFVSDGKTGTVTFPKALQPKFNSAKFKKLQAVSY